MILDAGYWMLVAGCWLLDENIVFQLVISSFSINAL
jgi:hypothetical protein